MDVLRLGKSRNSIGRVLVTNQWVGVARFHEMLRTRGYSSYEEYLASDAWKNFNIWYRQTDLPQFCLVCRSTQFQLHHWIYDNIGQDDPCDVVPLCEEHHHELHRWLASTGDPLHRVNVHLMKCFGMSHQAANGLFSQFQQWRQSSRKKLKRCCECAKRLSLSCPHDLCHKCARRDLTEWKRTQAAIYGSPQSAPTPISGEQNSIVRPEKPQKVRRDIRCKACRRLLAPIIKPKGNIYCDTCDFEHSRLDGNRDVAPTR